MYTCIFQSRGMQFVYKQTSHVYLQISNVYAHVQWRRVDDEGKNYDYFKNSQNVYNKWLSMQFIELKSSSSKSKLLVCVNGEGGVWRYNRTCSVRQPRPTSQLSTGRTRTTRWPRARQGNAINLYYHAALGLTNNLLFSFPFYCASAHCRAILI